MTYTARNESGYPPRKPGEDVPKSKNTEWGLKAPGRPTTPSEGHAQVYSRVGAPDGQKLVTYGNGTCLQFGPMDLVDEFNPDQGHPFFNQIAAIDAAVKNVQVAREPYEAFGDQSLRNDPFDNFRTMAWTQPRNSCPIYSIASGTYIKVPSKFASLTNTTSVYNVPNKSDEPGESFQFSRDTRFGVVDPLTKAALAKEKREREQKHGGSTCRGRRQRNNAYPPSIRYTYANMNDAQPRGRRNASANPLLFVEAPTPMTKAAIPTGPMDKQEQWARQVFKDPAFGLMGKKEQWAAEVLKDPGFGVSRNIEKRTASYHHGHGRKPSITTFAPETVQYFSPIKPSPSIAKTFAPTLDIPTSRAPTPRMEYGPTSTAFSRPPFGGVRSFGDLYKQYEKGIDELHVSSATGFSVPEQSGVMGQSRSAVVSPVPFNQSATNSPVPFRDEDDEYTGYIVYGGRKNQNQSRQTSRTATPVGRQRWFEVSRSSSPGVSLKVPGAVGQPRRTASERGLDVFNDLS